MSDLLIDSVLKFFCWIEDWKFIGILAYNLLFFPNIFWKLKSWTDETNVLNKITSDWNWILRCSQNRILLSYRRSLKLNWHLWCNLIYEGYIIGSLLRLIAHHIALPDVPVSIMFVHYYRQRKCQRMNNVPYIGISNQVCLLTGHENIFNIKKINSRAKTYSEIKNNSGINFSLFYLFRTRCEI